jgi:hypothetical protein
MEALLPLGRVRKKEIFFKLMRRVRMTEILMLGRAKMIEILMMGRAKMIDIYVEIWEEQKL